MKLHQTRETLDVLDCWLAGSSFEDVNLSSSSFRNVNLAGTRISDANMSGVAISEANLAGVAITDSKVEGMTIDGILAFGDRPAAVARELTKRFEEVRRAGLPALAAHYAEVAPRGEITVVVGPAPPEQADAEELDGRLRAALAGNSVKDAAVLVATATGLPRRLVYARALVLGGEGGDAGR